MTTRLLCFVVLLSLRFAFQGKAQIQQVTFTPVKGMSGVPVGKITGIAQDLQGNLWFTDQTNGCLTRYNGYGMQRYNHDESNAASLGGTYPECIYVAPDGIMWIGFYGMGVDRLDPETGTFTHFRHDKNKPNSLCNDSVTAILQDHLGNLWVGNYGGLDLFDPKTGTFKHYQHNASHTNSLSSNRVRTIYEDRQGTLWVGTGLVWDTDHKDGGLNRFHPQSGTFIRYVNDPANPHSLAGNKVRALYEDSRGTFWVGTNEEGGLQIMNRQTGTFQRCAYNPQHPERPYRPPVQKGDREDHVTFIVEDGKGLIWIGTYNSGINRFDPVAHTTAHYENNSDHSGQFKDKSGWAAYRSRDGQIWISTQEANFYRANPYHVTIPHRYMGEKVNAFAEVNNILWIGTDQGLIRRNLTDGTEKRFLSKPNNVNSLGSNNVNRILNDGDSILWVGTMGGLNKLNLQRQTLTRYRHNSSSVNSLSSDSVAATLKDKDGSLWIGTLKGLDHLNISTGTFTHYQHDPSDNNSLSVNALSSLLKDSEGQLWVGTWRNGGLNVMDRKTGKFKHYLQGMSIMSLVEDSSRTIWVGTSERLYRYDRAKDQLLPYKDLSDKVVNSFVSFVTLDRNNNLWVGADNGLVQINASREQSTLYDNSSGVRGPILRVGSSYSGDGKLYFGDSTGYYVFSPQQLTNRFQKPEVAFLSFKLADKIITVGPESPLSQSLRTAKEITLNYKQNVFSLDFAVIDYTSLEDNRIAYLLQNYDNEWRQTGPEGRAYYFNVPPGHYVLRVKGINGSGVWTEKDLAIVITPPWWQTWWAYALFAIAVIGALWLFIYYRSRALLRENKRLEENVKARTLELTEQKDALQKTLEDLKRTQTQLIQSEKMASLGELTAGIAHEIQNPLNFVNNFAAVNMELVEEMEAELETGNVDEAKVIAGDIRDNDGKIAHHGQRADSIVKAMLLHARASSGQKETVNINQLTEEYLRLSYQGQRAKDKSFWATIETHFDTSLGDIHVVPQDIGRVLLNLFNNAFYAVGKKKEQLNGTYEPAVWVSTRNEGTWVIVSVKDNGTGIPQTVKEKVFQPFFTTKPTGEGTGLGLSLSYDIVTKGHGGNLSVQSKEGEGSEFVVQLPV